MILERMRRNIKRRSMYHVIGGKKDQLYYDHISSVRLYISAVIIVLMNLKKYEKLEIRSDGYIWKWDGKDKVI